MPHLIQSDHQVADLSLFLNQNCIALGFDEVGDLSEITARWQVKFRLQKLFSKAALDSIADNAGRLLRFREIETGDIVVAFDRDARVYHLGEVTGTYAFHNNVPEFKHRHPVVWFAKTLREDLLPETRNYLSTNATDFTVAESALTDLLRKAEASEGEECQNRLLNSKVGTTRVNEDGELSSAKIDPFHLRKVEATLDDLFGEVKSRGQEFIKDKLLSLEVNQMKQLVAGVLRGIGYKTLATDSASDTGRGFLVSADGLGLASTRIIVEVMHHKRKMGVQDMCNFIGGIPQGDRGLLVSTGGFAPEAREEADRTNTPITLIDLERLATLLTQYYDTIDSDTKALVPLRKIYWPV